MRFTSRWMEWEIVNRSISRQWFFFVPLPAFRGERFLVDAIFTIPSSPTKQFSLRFADDVEKIFRAADDKSRSVMCVAREVLVDSAFGTLRRVRVAVTAALDRKALHLGLFFVVVTSGWLINRWEIHRSRLPQMRDTRNRPLPTRAHTSDDEGGIYFLASVLGGRKKRSRNESSTATCWCDRKKTRDLLGTRRQRKSCKKRYTRRHSPRKMRKQQQVALAKSQFIVCSPVCVAYKFRK